MVHQTLQRETPVKLRSLSFLGPETVGETWVMPGAEELGLLLFQSSGCLPVPLSWPFHVGSTWAGSGCILSSFTTL
jgi:hypothetical protein